MDGKTRRKKFRRRRSKRRFRGSQRLMIRLSSKESKIRRHKSKNRLL